MKPVVAAAIVDSLHQPRTLLAAQRSYPKELAGKFELPGGKVEWDEDPLQALRREILEELGVNLEIGSPLPGPSADTVARTGFAAWPLLNGRHMWVWFAQVVSREQPRVLGSHTQVKWVNAHQALELAWLPSNTPIVEAIVPYLLRGQHMP